MSAREEDHRRVAAALRAFCDLDEELSEEIAAGLVESPQWNAIADERAAEALEAAADSFNSEGEAIEVALGGAAYVMAELRRDAATFRARRAR